MNIKEFVNFIMYKTKFISYVQYIKERYIIINKLNYLTKKKNNKP